MHKKSKSLNKNKAVDSDETSSEEEDEEELQDQVGDVNESMISFGRQYGGED